MNHRMRNREWVGREAKPKSDRTTKRQIANKNLTGANRINTSDVCVCACENMFVYAHAHDENDIHKIKVYTDWHIFRLLRWCWSFDMQGKSPTTRLIIMPMAMPNDNNNNNNNHIHLR